MARISSYIKDGTITIDDKLIGSSYEGEGISGAIFETKNFKIRDLLSFFSRNLEQGGEVYNLGNLFSNFGTFDENGNLTSISEVFSNNLVDSITTVPDTFTQLALSNLDAIPQSFADFIFTIADINETFANSVLDLATSTAYATLDQFTQLEEFTQQIDTNVQGLDVSLSSLTSTVDTNTGAITATATSLDALGVRVTTAETDVVALNTEITTLSTTVDENTGNITTNANSITTLGTVVDTATTDIATLKVDVTTLSSSIDTVSGEVAANASDITLLTTNVDTVVADVTALETSVTTLETTVNTNTGDIATQATAVDLLATRVDTAEADILNTATEVTTLTTTVDGNTGAIATNASDISILQTNVDTATTDITAIQTSITQLETSVDEAAGLIEANATQIEGIATNVSLKPNIFYQDDPPEVTEPIGSLWFDTNDANKGYVLVSGSPENVWTEASDTRIAAAQADITNLSGDITTLGTTVDTNTGNISTNATNIETLSTSVTLLDTTVTAVETNVTDLTTTVDTATGDITANAQAISTLSASVDDATASIETNAEAIATTDGKLSASYGLTVSAGNKVAGLKLLADGTTTSSFIAQADTFGVEMPNGTRVLTVDANGLVLDGSGTFSGNITITSGTTFDAINTAQSTADGAVTAAGDAQSTADTANTAAGNAQTAADTAQTTADNAATAASNAQGTADTALGRTVDAAGKITFNPAPSGTGLFMNASNLGYYDTDTWKTYMDNSGNFYLSGDGNNGLSWDGSTLTINGSGTFSGTLDVGSISINNYANPSIDLLYDGASGSRSLNFRGQNGSVEANIYYLGLVDNLSINSNGDVFINPGSGKDVKLFGDVILGNATTPNINLSDLAVYHSYTSTSSTTLQKHYQILPGGVIMQWGYQTGSSSTVTVTFPLAFPTACRSVSVTTNRTSSGGNGFNHANTLSKTSFRAVVDSPYDFWWIAFGD
jgi:predicted  nucleic acid-binding Zn-ribbon protein